jgi:hypothetical protein
LDEIYGTEKTLGLLLPVSGKDAIHSPIFFDYNMVKSLKLKSSKHSKMCVDDSPAGVIFHELGHFCHNINGINFCRCYHSFQNACWYKNGKPKELYHKITNTVASYATSDPYGCEFVAELFAGLAVGKTFDLDIMALYRKLNGPTL